MKAGSQRHYGLDFHSIFENPQHMGLDKADYFSEEVTEESAKHYLLGQHISRSLERVGSGNICF